MPYGQHIRQRANSDIIFSKCSAAVINDSNKKFGKYVKWVAGSLFQFEFKSKTSYKEHLVLSVPVPQVYRDLSKNVRFFY